MAITTLAGLYSNLRQPVEFYKVGTNMQAVGVPYSFWRITGNPTGGSVTGANAAGSAVTSPTTGQLRFGNPVSGNAYLATLKVSASQPGTLFLCDRLWDNTALSSSQTTGQTVNSAAFPARDRSGTINGEGVLIGYEVQTNSGNASPITNTTLTYTGNTNGAAQTATMASFPANCLANSFIPFELAGGDTGVKSIQTYTGGTTHGNNNSFALVAYRRLLQIDFNRPNVTQVIDGFSANLRFYNSSVPFFIWIPTSTTAVNISGQLTYAHG